MVGRSWPINAQVGWWELGFLTPSMTVQEVVVATPVFTPFADCA